MTRKKSFDFSNQRIITIFNLPLILLPIIIIIFKYHAISERGELLSELRPIGIKR